MSGVAGALSQSHDGPVAPVVERSSHLEEYSRMRPASAGSRPRTLLNKLANVAATVQADDDDPDPADAEPWVLEGWGEGPSVSEAAQQASLKLTSHFKNAPTTLVGLGAAGPGRRVLSAGPGGRSSLLKTSEARRKPGSGPPLSQAEGRRMAGAAASPVRRLPPPANLEVGDESDVEMPPRNSATGNVGAGPARTLGRGAAAPGLGPGAASPARASPQRGQRPAAGPGAGGPRTIQASIAQQLVQNTPGARPGMRPTAGSSTGAAPGAGSGSPMQQPGSPAPRSTSAEGGPFHSPAGAGTGTPPRAGLVAARVSAGPGGEHHSPASCRPPPHPPHPPSSHAAGHAGAYAPGHAGEGAPGGAGSPVARPSRTFGGPSDPGDGLGNRQCSPLPRAPSFNSKDNGSSHANGAGSNLAPRRSGTQDSVSPPPPLPGLLPSSGRRNSSSFRETGLSGWDADGPGLPSTPGTPGNQPLGSPSVPSLWIGPTGNGSGTSGLQVGTGAPPPGGARGGPPSSQASRREQPQGGSANRVSGAPDAGSPADTGAAPSTGAGRGAGTSGSPAPARPGVGPRPGAGRATAATAGSPLRAPSPDKARPPVLPLPANDSLTDWVREAGTGGTASGGSAGPDSGRGPPSRSQSGGTGPQLPSSVPVGVGRVPGLTKARV